MPTLSCRERHRSGAVVLIIASLGLPASADSVKPGTDILRATVQIRNGYRRGSGTIFKSVPGETLVLTAAHVVKDPTGLTVELHRHNLGYRSTGLTEGGGWPRVLDASLVGTDPGGDVAVLRIKSSRPLPFTARFDPDAREPKPGEVLTSIGIDRTRFLTRWQATVEGATRLDFGQGGGPAWFTVVSRFPEHGRSGGGLFRPDGTIVGVCTGQGRIRRGLPRVGLFGSVASIRRILETGVHEAGRLDRAPAPCDMVIDAQSVARSEGRTPFLNPPNLKGSGS
jgi:S1-C subfamily serine protease